MHDLNELIEALAFIEEQVDHRSDIVNRLQGINEFLAYQANKLEELQEENNRLTADLDDLRSREMCVDDYE